MKLDKYLLHPLTIFSGIAIGIYIGLEKKVLANKISPLGNIYLSLLQMCVLPIMISAVVSSIGKLLKAGETISCIKKLVSVFVISMLLVSSLTLLIGVIAKPGRNLSQKSKLLLSKEIVKMEGITEKKLSKPSEKKEIFYFIEKIIPNNIFNSLSKGNSLSILFFCLLIGIAFGVIKSENTELVLKGFDATYEAVLKIISWIMYGLPFGLCFIFAGQMSKIGIGVLKALLKTVILFYFSSFLFILLYTIIIWIRSKQGIKKVLYSMKEPLIVAFGTSSSFASIPAALKALHKKLNFDKQETDLVIPLGISLNPHGNVLHFTMVAVFMLQLYGKHLNLIKSLLIIIFTPLAAIASAGAPGITALSMLSIILQPLGLPIVIATILFTAIDPIIDPILTVLNVYGNCVACSLIAKIKSTKDDKKF